MTTTNTATATPRAWTCPHCRATNVTPRCGCGPSREERGEWPVPALTADDIHLELPARRPRRAFRGRLRG